MSIPGRTEITRAIQSHVRSVRIPFTNCYALCACGAGEDAAPGRNSEKRIETKMVRIPFTCHYVPCTCGAIEKDDCECIRVSILSNMASATSGDARSPNIDCADFQAISRVSDTKIVASRTSAGIFSLLISKCRSSGLLSFMRVLSKGSVIGKSHCTEE